MAVGWVIVTDVVKLHPFLSFTVQVYEPAVNPVTLEVVCPLLHVYVYAVVPPEGVTEAVPLFPPLHDTFVCAVVVDIAAGCVIVTVVVYVHPFLSFTVHVYVPAVNPFMLEVVCPLLHE
jgi:hypothetical protein